MARKMARARVCAASKFQPRTRCARVFYRARGNAAQSWVWKFRGSYSLLSSKIAQRHPWFPNDFRLFSRSVCVFFFARRRFWKAEQDPPVESVEGAEGLAPVVARGQRSPLPLRVIPPLESRAQERQHQHGKRQQKRQPQTLRLGQGFRRN